MNTLADLDPQSKTILVRADLDVPLKNGQVQDTTRLEFLLPTLEKLLDSAKKIIVLGHLGRPDGKQVDSLKLTPVALALASLVTSPEKLEVHENLRFQSGEEQNNPQFTKDLASLGDVFVNDAFATSHRRHASIIGLPQYLPSFLGLHFVKEINALNKVINQPKKPVIFVLGGAKIDTKLPLVTKLASQADFILLGGLLAKHDFSSHSNIISAQQTPDGKDITLESAQDFSRRISQAGTVVWNGPVGVFEQPQHSQGTKLIAQAINQTSAYTVIGGGDTEAAATKFNAESDINWISSGGGAMLSYLADDTLPGIEAIENNSGRKK